MEVDEGEQDSDKNDDKKKDESTRRKRQAGATTKQSTLPSTKATTPGPTSPKSTTLKPAKMVPGKVSLIICTQPWLRCLDIDAMVRLHCPTRRQTHIQTDTDTDQLTPNPIRIFGCVRLCIVNTSTQFYTTHFRSVSVSGSVNTP